MEKQPILLRRIAETLCVCDMTDGFCMPKNNPGCRCWKMAKAIYRTLLDAPHPVLLEGWTVTHEAYLKKDKADPAKVLEAMLRATPNLYSAAEKTENIPSK